MLNKCVKSATHYQPGHNFKLLLSVYMRPNHMIARSDFEVHVKFLRSKCNEGCDWCIYVTVITCADIMT